jgi:vanillate O-demethylase ferredoxin subunit
MPSAPGELEVFVRSVTWEAPDIHSWDLRPRAGGELPAFTAGAHVDLHLPNGMLRSYSLVNPQTERHRYVIAAQKDRASRGGSRCLHEQVKTGDTLRIGAPRNNFPLAEDAPHSVLFAGGIGITPVFNMAGRLAALGRSWALHYCARSRGAAAFLEPMAALASDRGRVHLHFDDEHGGNPPDLAEIVGAAGAGTHFYCCGPLPMLAAFEAATAALPAEQVHVEYFTAKDAPAKGGGFTVVLAKSGVELVVPEGKTILETALDAGIAASYSCMEGVCGTCETRVLEGIPEHRDLVLTRAEQASNRTMMICCSGCKGERLVLEL